MKHTPLPQINVKKSYRKVEKRESKIFYTKSRLRPLPNLSVSLSVRRSTKLVVATSHGTPRSVKIITMLSLLLIFQGYQLNIHPSKKIASKIVSLICKDYLITNCLRSTIENFAFNDLSSLRVKLRVTICLLYTSPSPRDS